MPKKRPKIVYHRLILKAHIVRFHEWLLWNANKDIDFTKKYLKHIRYYKKHQESLEAEPSRMLD